jgi:hypothetical protein
MQAVTTIGLDIAKSIFQVHGVSADGLAVRTIDEHQGSEIIGKGKATKLVCVEPAIIVVANDATDHHEDAERIRLLDQKAQCIVPRLPPVLQVESKRSPDRRRSGLYVAVQLCGSDERKRMIALGARKFAVPFLTLPAELDAIEQVRARKIIAPIASGAEVRNGHALDRRLR